MNIIRHTPLPNLDMLVLVLVVWLCALPFIGFLIIPVFGIGTALGTALALLIVLLLVCWGRCISVVIHFYQEK
jgi:hypothetical protein